MGLFPEYETTYNGYHFNKSATNSTISYTGVADYTISGQVQSDDLGQLDSVINGEQLERYNIWVNGDVTATVREMDRLTIDNTVKYIVADQPQYKRLMNQTQIQLIKKDNTSA